MYAHSVLHTWTLYMDTYITPNYSYPKWKDVLREAIITANKTGNALSHFSRKHRYLFLSPGKNRKVSSISELVCLVRGSKNSLCKLCLSRGTSPGSFLAAGSMQPELCCCQKPPMVDSGQPAAGGRALQGACLAKPGPTHRDEEGETDISLLIKMQFI